MKPLITKLIFFFIIAILLNSSGCVPLSSEPTGQPEITPNNLPTPKQGFGIVSGILTNPDNTPLVSTTVRLAEVYYNAEGDGAFALDESFSPSTLSNTDGTYLFLDVNPGDYVLFVGSLNSDYVIVSGTEGQALVHKVVAGQITTLDPISIDFSN